MKKRAKIYLIAISCISLALFAILSFFFIRSQAVTTSQQALNNYLEITTTLSAPPTSDAQSFVETLAKSYSENMRITLVFEDGTVLGDSHAASADMDNHLLRDEISQAFATGYGSALRPSDTTGVNTLYVAKRWEDSYVLRISMPVSASREFANQMLPVLLLTFVILCMLITVMVERFAKKLVVPYEKMLLHIERVIQKERSTQMEDLDFSVEYEEMQPIMRYFQYLLSQISSYIAEITEKTQEVENIVENMQEGLILLDSEMNILTINPQASRFLAIPQNSWQRQITYLYRTEAFVDMIHTAQKKQSHQMIDIKSEENVYRFYINPVPAGGFVLLISDVTEIIRLEQMRSDFVANVSHELKTPLTSISGFAELIHTGIVTDQTIIQDYAGKIHEESLRLVRLIDDILHLSTVENAATKESPLSIEAVDANDTFTNVLQLLAPQVEQKHLQVNITGALSLHIDRDHLQELVLNLCDNAIKYNNCNGAISICLLENGFSVSDTGIGIPPQHLERIFERFYRVDHARSRKTGGTGLGLSICKHITALYGGSISVVSNEKGTTFTAIFPPDIVVAQ